MKKTYRRKKYNKSSYGNNALSIAKMALKGVGFLKSVLNPERKFLDFVGTNFAVINTGTFDYLSGIAQGDGVNARSGNSVKLSSMLFRATISLDPAATVSSNVRVLLFYDKDNLGTAPAVTDLLQNVTVHSPLELSTQTGGRFQVMYDRVFSLNLTRQNTNIKVYKKLSHHLKYGGTTAAQADARSGAMYLLLLSDATVNFPRINLTNRIRYYDN